MPSSVAVLREKQQLRAVICQFSELHTIEHCLSAANFESLA